MTTTRPLFLFLLLISIKIFAAAGCDVTILESTNRYIIAQARFDSISFVRQQQDGEWFTHIKLAGAGETTEPGAPQLPLATIRLGIPETARPQLTVLSQQMDVKNIGAIQIIETLGSEQVNFSQSSYYPNETAEIALDAVIRDQRILYIHLFPVRYQQKTQSAQILKTLQFKIDFGEKTQPSFSATTWASDSLFKTMLDNFDDSKKWRRSANPSLAKANKPALPMAKLFIKNTGVYKVTGYELLQNGVDIRNIDPRTLALTNKGEPVPIIVEGKSDGELNVDDRIIFLGQHNSGDKTFLSPFSDTNVYQLSWGGQGLAYTELLASPNGTETDTLDTAPHSIHFEKDLRYERLVGHDNGDDDHWLWEKLMNDERINFPITLPGLMENSSLQLTAKFHGLSESNDVEMNHHVLAYMDDQQIGEAYGSQKKPFSLYSNQFAVSGRNINRMVHFDLPLDNANVFADFVFLNWFNVDYERSLSAGDDQLEFTLEPHNNRIWRLSGFSSDQVYLLTDTGYRLMQPKVKSRADGFELLCTFPSRHTAKLYVVGAGALRSVTKIEMDQPSDLANPGNSADYVVITHEKFESSAERLATYRAAQGLKTMVVDIQDVYDEFSASNFDPRAIKKFIAYTFTNWQKPTPLYFLLLGDTTYLMDKDVAADATLQSYVPSYMVNTKSFGMTSSDNYFACVSGNDALPDVYIGRLPANSVDDADAMIDKIISYETTGTADEWRRHVTLASGNGEFFDMSAQNLVDNYLPKWLVTSRLSTEYQSPFFNTTEDFINWINSGQNIINFLVHGSGEQIADAKLFEKDDILRLTNDDRYAFAVTMSCYIGHFDHPEKNSLGEELFTAPGKGIMGMFGSAGKSYLYSDYYFNAAVFDGIYNKGWRTLGEITTNAKYELIAQTKGFWEPVHNFLLIGDPAARLNVPESKLNFALAKKVLAEGDVLSVKGTTPSTNGTLYLEATGPMDSVLAEKNVPIQNGSVNVDVMTLTSQVRQKWGDFGGIGQVRAFYSDGITSSVGLMDFAVVQPLVPYFGIVPEKPTGFEPVTFQCKIDASAAAEVGGIASVTVDWSLDQSTWTNISLSKSDELWVSDQTVAQEEGSTIYYKLNIRTNSGTVSETEVKSYQVLYKPDLYVDTDVRYWKDFLKVTIKNRGESDAHSVVLRIMDKTSGVTLIDDFSAPIVRGREDTTVVIPVADLAAGVHELDVMVDPENKIPEEEEENNSIQTSLFVVTPDLGSGGVFNFENSNCRLTVPPKSVSQTASIQLVKISNEQFEKKAEGSSLVLLDADDNNSLFQITLADSLIALDQVNVILNIDPGDSLSAAFLSSNSVRIYAWMEETASWRGIESVYEENAIKATLSGIATTFALMGSADVQAPTITISAQGQNFADGDIVPPNPLFTIALEDESGLDMSPTHLQMWLDDIVLNELDYVVSSDPNQNGLAQISLSTEFMSGEHVLKIHATDVNANAQSKEVTFRIAEQFGLDFIANHPNPFVDETTFAFSITDIASHVDLNIYTVSGRLIRSFEFTDITGYNEVDWDGADSDGNEIANGVYYLKFSAWHGDEKIERIERLAKLR